MQFVKVLDDFNIPHQTEGRYSRPGWVQIRCPYCKTGSDPDKFYMGYNTAHRYVNCWRCGRHDLVDTLCRITHSTYQECRDIASRLDKQHLPERVSRTGRLVMPVGVDIMLPCHEAYLAERGFDPAAVTRLWGVRGIGLAPRLAWRLWIPIHLNGRVVSWTTRAIGQRVTQRYISAGLQEEEYPHKELLYGEDYCRHAVIVHEGPLDVWATGPGAVGTCGVGFSPGQVAAIARYPVRAICYDNEPEAQQRARALADSLSVFDGETFNVTLDSHDAASATPQERATLRKHFLG